MPSWRHTWNRLQSIQCSGTKNDDKIKMLKGILSTILRLDDQTPAHITEAGILIDWLGFNGNFNTNRLHCAFEKYTAVKKWNQWESWQCYAMGTHTLKPLKQITLQSGLCMGKPFDITRVCLPSQSLGKCTNKQNIKIQKNTQLNKPEPLLSSKPNVLMCFYT